MNESKTKVLILCAGNGSKWGEYLGIPKQLITINSESLLERTVRLLHENGICDIDIVSNDERLMVNNCGFFRPSGYRWTVETFYSTKDLWQERIIVLLGDIFYSEHAMRTIVRSDNRIQVFGRRGPSRFTKSRWQEIFAISFYQKDIADVMYHTKVALGDAEKGGNGRLWQFYRSLAGLPLNALLQTETKIFKSIDDFTDDFDTPEDYNRAIRRYEFVTSTNPLKRWSIKIWIFLNVINWIYTVGRYLEARFIYNPLLRNGFGRIRLWIGRLRNIMQS
jgi:hypothetical protein